jgi:hypothetical protein
VLVIREVLATATRDMGLPAQLKVLAQPVDTRN